jgi:hypothetical protein
MELKVLKVEVVYHKPGTRRPKARMYFWPEKETILENLLNRHDRPHLEYKKLIKLALVEAGIELSQAKSTKARWSQRAGCSCPCSPGFILSELYGRDFHVTYEAK